MNRKLLFVVSVAALVLVSAIYLNRTGFSFKKKEAQQPVQQAEKMDEKQAQTPAAPAESTEEAPTVEIPLDKQQMLGLKTAEVSMHDLKKTLRTVGRIEYDERRLSTINAKFEGWIEKLFVDYTGRYVKKGEPLCEIYSPELVATQQEFINAVRWGRSGGGTGSDPMKAMLLKDANSLIEAVRRRLSLWDISEDQIKKIEESGKPIRTLTLYSPVSGYVVQKMALQGMRVMPGEKLFDLADLGTVWIVAEIYENELSMIRQGQSAMISLSYFPEKKIKAVIDYIYPTLSAESRTARVRFIVPNPGGQLKPQMFTNVEIAVSAGRRLAVPEESVLDSGIRQVAYVDKGDGYFEPREIRTGVRVDGMIEVLEGLKAGDKIASSAIFLLDSEAQLKGVRPLSSGHKH